VGAVGGAERGADGADVRADRSAVNTDIDPDFITLSRSELHSDCCVHREAIGFADNFPYHRPHARTFRR
jgi:hypothetical protein